MKKRNLMLMNLQMFADPAPAPDPAPTPTPTPQPAPAPEIDYDKIQKMLDGTLAAKEDTALKAYFKQQGLSQEEAEQAMSVFKQQKAANQPDVNALQTQLSQAQAAAQQAQIESAATMAAVELGIDAKAIPYVLKMADFGQAVGEDGTINEETLKEALNKVLEDIPALKPQEKPSSGFTPIGAASSGTQQHRAIEPLTLKGAIAEALKK